MPTMYTSYSEQSWEAPEGSPWRSLDAQEVADLKNHAETLDPNQVLTAHDAPASHPRVTRIQDIHENWDVQHPLLREILERRGLTPQG